MPFPFSLILIVGASGLFGVIAGMAFSWIEAAVYALNLPLWVANTAATLLAAGVLEYQCGFVPFRTGLDLDSTEALQRSPGSRACCFSACVGS